MNNFWNRVIYKIWSPVYDKIFNSGVFLHARRQVFQNLHLNSGKKILFVGVGTGADIELITHSELEITAIDLSPEMLNKARIKFKNFRIDFLEMDAQNMSFSDTSFDYVVGSLILSVVPDANKCFQEMERVLKLEGKMILFDKFIPVNKDLSLTKKLLRPFIKVLGTDIGLDFNKIYLRNNKNLKIVEDEPIMFNGMYRKIILSKDVSIKGWI